MAVKIACRYVPRHKVKYDLQRGTYEEVNSFVNTKAERFAQQILLAKEQERRKERRDNIFAVIFVALTALFFYIVQVLT